MAKIPGQKQTHNDISKQTRNQIMKEIKTAWASDTCTATNKQTKK